MLKEAGAIVIAKTNMPEMAQTIGGWSKLNGYCRNPHNLNYQPGGSSSGTATGIAAGVASCGLGSDTGGSVRVPAEACGIVGFRPSLGRYSGEGIVPLWITHDTIGPQGATVSDVALLDSAIMGFDYATEFSHQLETITVGVPTGWIEDSCTGNNAPNLEALELAI